MSDSLAEQIGAPERWDGEYEGNDAGMTGIDVAADINLVGPLSAYVMAKAIASAARSARSIDGYKAVCDL